MNELKIITIEIDLGKVKHNRLVDYRTQQIINENWVQFSKALYSDFDDVNENVFKLIRDLVHKFHLYE
jgi:hypothetical protein